ncbi:MAG: cupin domain-containing protein [Ignavibacteria bacterium]|jgi:cupin 2 domain-containing protein|nr:cupin domain-containing protein [Ignavibacteria bacterium]MCU7501975.1 cupin domain-containing protein [Ignavibacteria bacterium]MCU7516943.1 cupin domain-containing protein [Ignavibacteria bacterium]
MEVNNLFSEIPDNFQKEIFDILIHNHNLTLERIVSCGQASPEGEWYEQETNEWVILLGGSAGLLFEGESDEKVLYPGDYILIPANTKHRIEWTDRKQKTVWLALHYMD